MNTKNEYIGKNEPKKDDEASITPVILVLLVTLGSGGLIPFAYALTFGTHNPRLQRRLPLERQHSGAFWRKIRTFQLAAHTISQRKLCLPHVSLFITNY